MTIFAVMAKGRMMMASCKECIYEPKCFYRVMYGKGVDETGKPTISKLQMCGHFKNKAGFQEVKHGEWIARTSKINQNDLVYRCSVCGELYLRLPKYKYCPNCGAKMDGEKNE